MPLARRPIDCRYRETLRPSMIDFWMEAARMSGNVFHSLFILERQKWDRRHLVTTRIQPPSLCQWERLPSLASRNPCSWSLRSPYAPLLLMPLTPSNSSGTKVIVTYFPALNYGGPQEKTVNPHELWSQVQQPGHGVGHEHDPTAMTSQRANATFVILARNSDLEGTVNSVRDLEDRFNRRYQYPYVFLNDKPFDEKFKKLALFMLSTSHCD
jgi:Glycolipid 2-alpha-mannosyltransferase